MAGTLLSPNQIAALNAAYPALVAHLRSLLVADHSGYGLMRVHSQVESFDSDEMVRIFGVINFITAFEKKALVRAAVYELMAVEPELFVSPAVTPLAQADKKEPTPKGGVPAGTFKPNFQLNVAKSNAEEIAKTDTKPTPPPPTSTVVLPKTVSERIVEGNKEQKAQAEALEVAAETAVAEVESKQAQRIAASVARLQESSAPTPTPQE